MMRILVNFLPIYKGGGLQNAVNFWRTSTTFNKDDYWICIARKGSEIINLPQDEHHIIKEIKVSRNYLLRFINDNIRIRRIVREHKIDIVFTLAGPGPIRGSFRSINGWHEPAYVYPESDFWNRITPLSRLFLKVRYIYSTLVLKKANAITVQTNTMRKRMVKYRKINESKIYIVPNGITSYSEEDYMSPRLKSIFEKLENRIKLLVLTEPWVHKNLDYLLKVVHHLPEPYVFCVSFDLSTNELAADFIKEVEHSDKSDYFAFLGRVQHREIKRLYQKVDAVFLPTLLESFSANYIEAMYYNIPIFTSEMDFSREVCGHYAYYFDPFDEQTAVDLLMRYFSKRGKEDFDLKLKSLKFSYPGWKERFEMYYNIIRDVAME